VTAAVHPEGKLTGSYYLGHVHKGGCSIDVNIQVLCSGFLRRLFIQYALTITIEPC